MTEDTKPITGGCRCGRTRFRITAPPMLTMACHCTGCQRMTGSAFSLSLAVPAEAFEIVAGTPVLGGLDRTMHHHCPDCLGWLFTRPPGMDWFVNVRAGALDDAGWFAPFVETYTEEKMAWATTPARHSFARLPALDHYEELMRDYAARGRKPA